MLVIEIRKEEGKEHEGAIMFYICQKRAKWLNVCSLEFHNIRHSIAGRTKVNNILSVGHLGPRLF